MWSDWVLQPEQAFSYSHEKSSSLVEETFIFKKHKHINICIHRFETYFPELVTTEFQIFLMETTA